MLALSLLALFPAAEPAGKLDLEPDELRPGLVAAYRSVADPAATLTRVEPKPAFTLGRSSPHPRLPPGPFEVTYTGVLAVRDFAPLTLSAIVGGGLTITIDGETVLDGRGPTDATRLAGKPLDRKPGFYLLSIRYRSLPDVPARLQLWWQGPAFAAEPIPAWRLGHTLMQRPKALDQDDLITKGRMAAVSHGCARCHASTLPGVTDPPPGPSLADAGRRLGKGWLLNWLADPAKVRPDAHMPALFDGDRAGFVDRWLVAESLAGPRAITDPPGDHRRGKHLFLSIGCVACHLIPDPDVDHPDQKPLGRVSLTGTALGDRLTAADLAAFLGNPHGRYPDGRMPRMPLTPAEAQNLAAYLLLWSKPTPDSKPDAAPTADELRDAAKRAGVRNPADAAGVLLREKGCVSCHAGLGEPRPRDVPIASAEGCLTGKAGPRFKIAEETRAELAAYFAAAAKEKHPSPVFDRQQRLDRAGCVRCHQRDHDRPPVIEEVGTTIGGSNLMEIPFLRTPRLTNPHQKFTRTHLAAAVREGVSGLRWSRFSYRMPAFGTDADALVQALAEADGELASEPDPVEPVAADPTLGTVHGPQLAGFQGYGCASCHVWNGKLLGSPDPGATGPDLTRTVGRIRRDFFDRYLEGPQRFHPNAPMPAVFVHGKPASLDAILGGDVKQQKEALWAYLARGKDPPSPKPPAPLPTPAPAAGSVLVAQIPLRLPDGRVVESLALLNADNDLLVYDLAEGGLHTHFAGGQILRNVQGRVRQFLAAGTPTDLSVPSPVRLIVNSKPELPVERTLRGYDRLPDGATVRWKLTFPAGTVSVEDTLRFVPEPRRLVRELKVSDVPANAHVELRGKVPAGWAVDAPASDGVFAVKANAAVRYDLPAARPAPAWDGKPLAFADAAEGSLERPGYRAIAYPRPKTISGEDRVMPGAIAVRPKDGQVFVASVKTGELFALRDPGGDGKNARFEDYAHGLFQDSLSMLADDDGLYLLHRRNLTKITESPDGTANRFERLVGLPHGVADTYDLAYGLARDAKGHFVFGYAPHANHTLPGSGGALRLVSGKLTEVCFGFRNPIGWTAGPDGEVFVTDNQGEWVATNKLSHVSPGTFHGYPNRQQPEHAKKPFAKPVVWVPYGWGRSLNGVTHDSTGGKFGPFAGQIFMAELMFGGGIVRANVEKVNGVYQGACFPFWGKGLLGPLTMAFDPRGRLYVGSVTEPGWMAQPDRGAVFRIDFTGKTPFELKAIHARPQGYRVEFTAPVDKHTAANPASYKLEHYRYEYTGAYGSPELDRTTVKVERVVLADDGHSVELTTSPLVKDRVYLLTAAGVRSAANEPPVYPTGAYTLNEIPTP